MSGSGSSPNLRHNDSSLSLRTTFRKSQDVRGVLGTTTIDSGSRKIAAGYVMDERVFADQQNQDNDEQDGLLSSEVIDMGTNSGEGNDDNWYYYNSRAKEDSWRKKLLRRCTVSNFLNCFFMMFVLGFFIVITRVAISTLDVVSNNNKSALYYNGSTYFDSTVIYISLDGFRNDYLDRRVTPNIELLGQQGIRAEYMKPSFPSITFPNHWTLVTGLYPEAHGIVANEFYDPILQEEFIHKIPSISGDPKWWGGEPIWVTSTTQGKKSAVIMWPGSNVPIHNVEPDYYVAYTRATTAQDKMDIALGWLDLPKDERPQSISIYIPQIDQKGHGGGPEGKQLNGVLSDMDNAIGHLMQGLEARNLDQHVNLVVVSDHGMAASDKSRLVYYDQILSPESIIFLREREAWPLLGLRPKDDAPAYALDQIYNELYQYTQQHPDDAHFQVYRRENMPERFHYNATERIAPIIMIPDVGYSIIKTTDINPVTGKGYGPKGIHGYDNLAYEMRAIFAARGPTVARDYKVGSVVEPFFNTEMYRFLTGILDLTPAPNNSTLNGIFQVKNP